MKFFELEFTLRLNYLLQLGFEYQETDQII